MTEEKYFLDGETDWCSYSIYINKDENKPRMCMGEYDAEIPWDSIRDIYDYGCEIGEIKGFINMTKSQKQVLVATVSITLAILMNIGFMWATS